MAATIAGSCARMVFPLITAQCLPGEGSQGGNPGNVECFSGILPRAGPGRAEEARSSGARRNEAQAHRNEALKRREKGRGEEGRGGNLRGPPGAPGASGNLRGTSREPPKPFEDPRKSPSHPEDQKLPVGKSNLNFWMKNKFLEWKLKRFQNGNRISILQIVDPLGGPDGIPRTPTGSKHRKT